MADSNEPTKETVHITVSSRPTVRIHLPTRPPANPSPVPADSSSPARVAAAAMAAPMTTPKKETARMTVLPDPQPKPAVQMKKTQPLIDLPTMEAPATKVAPTPEPAPRPQPRIDQVPMLLCWTLLAVSAAILILQIWNYIS